MENSASSTMDRDGPEVFSEELDFGSWPASGRQASQPEESERVEQSRMAELKRTNTTEATESLVKEMFSEDFDFGEVSDAAASDCAVQQPTDKQESVNETDCQVTDGGATQMETDGSENNEREIEPEASAIEEVSPTDPEKNAQKSVDADDNVEHDSIPEANEARDQQPIVDDIDDPAGPAQEQQQTHGTKDAVEMRLVQVPLARVKQIMKLDPSVGIITAEALYVVAKASELFLQTLAKESYAHTTASKKKTIAKRDVEQSIESVDSLAFLEGMMNVR